MGLKGKTEQKINFALSFAITYPNNVLTINAVHDTGLRRQRKHACILLHIIHGLPFTVPGIFDCSLISQLYLVSCCVIACFRYNRNGPKIEEGMGPHLTQSRVGRRLPLYQVAS